MSLNQINQINVYELQDLPRNQINVFLIKQIIYLQFIYIYIEHIFDGLLSFTKKCDACWIQKGFFYIKPFPLQVSRENFSSSDSWAENLIKRNEYKMLKFWTNLITGSRENFRWVWGQVNQTCHQLSCPDIYWKTTTYKFNKVKNQEQI